MRPTEEQMRDFRYKLHEGYRKAGTWKALSEYLETPTVTLMTWKRGLKCPVHLGALKDVMKRIDKMPEGKRDQ